MSLLLEDDGELSEQEFLDWLATLDSSEDLPDQG